jgi:hypothetical protein
MHYNLGGFGMNSEANEGFDFYDNFNAPRFIQYLEIDYPKKYIGMTVTKDIVPTAQNYVWKFSVASNLEQYQTALTWDNSYFGQNRQIYLLDVATHRVTDMRAINRYEFDRSNSNEFRVIFGDAAFTSEALLPEQAILYDPYPNPFDDLITIDYALPGGAVGNPVTFTVLNSAGGKIVSATQPAQAGEGRWLWESQNQTSGLYVVQLTLGHKTLTRKIFKR